MRENSLGFFLARVIGLIHTGRSAARSEQKE